MIFLQLFYEFFKAGLFAIGGGLATLPFLKQISLRYPWFTPNDLMDMIAVSESTPGPMGVNSQRTQASTRPAFPVPHGDLLACAAIGHHHHSGVACA